MGVAPNTVVLLCMFALLLHLVVSLRNAQRSKEVQLNGGMSQQTWQCMCNVHTTLKARW